MESMIVIFSSITFLILFAFLIFIFTVIIISKIMKKDSYADFEPSISVIIPVYNESKNISACIDSIMNSDYDQKKIELIIVDDGSEDGTQEIVKNYRAKLIKQNHLGKTEALNNGVKNSSNEFVLAVDADTVLEKKCMNEIIRPFFDENVGACSGVLKIKNKNSLAGMFQSIEYHYNNLIRNSFSRTFKNGVWFFGAIACYRKSALHKVGMFKKDTITEDMDIAMELRKQDYKIINTKYAVGHTNAPENFLELYKQRARWWIGGLQTLMKNRKMFSSKYGVSSIFLFVNQFFWSFYAVVSLPIIIYQINYWLPYNSGSFTALFNYLFRWFSLYGPIWVLYKLPENGLSYFTIFGVISGILSVFMIVMAIKTFKDRLNARNIAAIFFYFPYTIVLNIIIVLSLVDYRHWKRRCFIK